MEKKNLQDESKYDETY